jgi:ribosomal protein S25
VNRITVAERRARLAVRHHVASEARVSTVVQAARDVVCLHASDPATVHVSARARMVDGTVEAVDRALYEDRELIRMLAMRRTMFVIPVDEAATIHAAASLAVARNERRRTEQLVASLGVRDVARWIRRAEKDALAALEARGEATARQVADDVPALRERTLINVGKRYQAHLGMAGRILLQLAADGRIVRGRPRGSWISAQYRWVTIERWLGRPFEPIPVDEARAVLVRRWLERFGPGTEADVRWWTGWSARAVRKALADIAAVPVDLDGVEGYVVARDLDTTPRPDPWVALLPALDPTTMGWQGRDWYLGPHRPFLFDSNGNAGPTIWADGRIIGGWAVRPAGEVVTKLLEDVGRETDRAVEAEAAELTGWYRSVQSIPRFPTPLYRELVG